MTNPEPTALSMIVPARNAAHTLARCLEAIVTQTTGDDEVIVVDDHSDDGTAEVAKRLGVKVIAMPSHRGAAAARNRGAAEAANAVLFFLDADVVLAAGALARAREDVMDLAFDAIVGSYDESPPESSAVSRFKNLAHHFFHQRAAGPISSFWGACGLVRRQTFVALGGFDEKRYVAPSIEDVEFGYRLTDIGKRIRIDPGLRVTHLKRWTLGSLLATDFTRRAIPWTVLCLERGGLSSDLNFSWDQRIAAVVAVGLVACAPLLFWRAAVVMFIMLLAASLAINRRLYRLFYAKGGVRLMLAGFGLQQVYYLYSLGGLAAGAALFAWRSSSELIDREAAGAISTNRKIARPIVWLAAVRRKS